MPGIKILVLRERKLAQKAPGRPKVPGPSGNPNRVPTPTNSSGPQVRSRLYSAPEPPTNSNPRKPERPIGSKTRKVAPFLNHSTIAQRTRRKFKTDARGLDTNPKRALTLKQDPKDPRIAQSDAVPKDDYSHPGQTSTDMPPSTTPALIDVSLGPQFRQPLDNLLS